MAVRGERRSYSLENEWILSYMGSFLLHHLARVEVLTNSSPGQDEVARNGRFGRLMTVLESLQPRIHRFKLVLSLGYKRLRGFDSERFFRRVDDSPLDLMFVVRDIHEGRDYPFWLLTRTSFTLVLSLTLETLQSPIFYHSCSQKVVSINTGEEVLQGRQFWDVLEKCGPAELVEFTPGWLDFSDAPDWTPDYLGPLIFRGCKVWPGVSNPTFQVIAHFIFKEEEPLEILNISGVIQLANNQTLVRLYGWNIADVLRMTVHFGCSYMTIFGFTVDIDSLQRIKVPFCMPNCALQRITHSGFSLCKLLGILAQTGLGKKELKMERKNVDSIIITGGYAFELKDWDTSTVVNEICGGGTPFTRLELYSLRLDSQVLRRLETLTFRAHNCCVRNEGHRSLSLSGVFKVFSSSHLGSELMIHGKSPESVTVIGNYVLNLTGWHQRSVISEMCREASPFTHLELYASWWLDNDILRLLKTSVKSVQIKPGSTLHKSDHFPFVDTLSILLALYGKSERFLVEVSEKYTSIDHKLTLFGWDAAEVGRRFLIESKNRVNLLGVYLTSDLLNLINKHVGVQLVACKIVKSNCTNASVRGFFLSHYSQAKSLLVILKNNSVNLQSTDLSISLTGWSILAIASMFLRTIVQRQIPLRFSLTHRHLKIPSLTGLVSLLGFPFAAHTEVIVKLTDQCLSIEHDSHKLSFETQSPFSALASLFSSPSGPIARITITGFMANSNLFNSLITLEAVRSLDLRLLTVGGSKELYTSDHLLTKAKELLHHFQQKGAQYVHIQTNTKLLVKYKKK